MKSLIKCIHLKRRFGEDVALNGVSVEFPSTGLVGVVGASGSGKSTLLNILSGLDVDYEGKCLLDGYCLKEFSERQRSRFRLKHIGYVFQNFNLLELDTAWSNVMLPLDALSRDPQKMKKRKCLDLLDFVGLSRKADQTVNTLSGGEKQRVAFARALVSDPAILLCDEPTGALDEKNSDMVFSLMQRIARKKLVIVVSHDLAMIEKYADCYIRLRDGRIADFKTAECGKIKQAPASLRLDDVRRKPRLSFHYLLGHAYRIVKTKFWRTLISEGSIALGLIGIGLSSYISTSISGELNKAFSSMIAQNQIVMSPREEVGPSSIENVYAAGFDQAEYILGEYGDEISAYGSSFLANFEQWFTDDNEFYFQSGVNQVVLPGFSVRSINDCLHYSELENLHYYPAYPGEMEMDEVVLGLPFSTMFNVSFALHILRNYEALGQYIYDHGLNIVLRASRVEWGYEDEELFAVKAIVATEYPCIIHSDPLFARHMLIDKMGFRSSLTEETPTAQYLYEIPYLLPKGLPSEFLRLAREDEELDNLVFEMPNSNYLSSVCPVGAECGLTRLYLYSCDKTGIGWPAIFEAEKVCPDIEGRIVSTPGSFYAEAGSIMMGFAQKFFLCPSQDSCFSVIDSYSQLPKDVANLALTLPDGVKDGNFLSSSSGGLRFSSDFSRLVEGRKPASEEEILLSRSLYEEWGKPEVCYVAASISEEEVGNNLIRDFSSAELKVVGVTDDDQTVFYAQSDWTVDFFFDVLRMSSFALEPSGAVFCFASKEKATAGMEALEKAFPQCAFSFPAQEMESSVSETVGYVGRILTIFSLVALVISGLLFTIVMSITMTENAGEGYLFYVVGVSRRDIAKSYFCHCLLYSGAALLTAAISLLIAEVMVSLYIGQTFHTGARVSVALAPIGLVAVVALAFSLIIMFTLFLLIQKKNFAQR